MPFTGHVNPGLPIAEALVKGGHDVRWYTTPRFQRAVERVGARFVPYDRATAFDEQRLDEQLPRRRALRGLNQLRHDLTEVFINPVPKALADVEAEMAREPFNIAVGCSTSAVPVK